MTLALKTLFSFTRVSDEQLSDSQDFDFSIITILQCTGQLFLPDQNVSWDTLPS